MPIIDEDTPQLRSDLANAASFLMPLAQAHHEQGKWPVEVVAWLMMVRDSLRSRSPRDAH